MYVSGALVPENHHAIPRMGRIQSISTGFETLRSRRKRDTPRSRKNTCASRARFRRK